MFQYDDGSRLEMHTKIHDKRSCLGMNISKLSHFSFWGELGDSPVLAGVPLFFFSPKATTMPCAPPPWERILKCCQVRGLRPHCLVEMAPAGWWDWGSCALARNRHTQTHIHMNKYIYNSIIIYIYIYNSIIIYIPIYISLSLFTIIYVHILHSYIRVFFVEWGA